MLGDCYFSDLREVPPPPTPVRLLLHGSDGSMLREAAGCFDGALYGWSSQLWESQVTGRKEVTDPCRE